MRSMSSRMTHLAKTDQKCREHCEDALSIVNKTTGILKETVNSRPKINADISRNI